MRQAKLSKKKKTSIFVVEMCVFLLRPIKITTFHRKNGDPKMGCWLASVKGTVLFFKKNGNRRCLRRKNLQTTTTNPGNRRGFLV